MKPWYKVATPREDLRNNKPLDASEFAVHLDHVRDGRAPEVYQQPTAFFERTFLTKNLRELMAQVIRRLSGIRVETSAIFNLSTQFGGGKTHALTSLYHIATGGDAAKEWKGIPDILLEAGVTSIPVAATAIFVGTEFDSITGRGGTDGTPHRKTPWGEIAFQLGKAEGYRLLERHDAAQTAPGGDVIEQMLPRGKPVLILLDELMNYVNRTRKSGLAAQFYTFLHNLSEVARARDNVVLAVSIPASELEMTAEDQSDFERFKKLLDRLGKAIIMSANTEASEIIRRRLFEWHGLPKDAQATIDDYAEWLQANKHQIPNWFPAETSRQALEMSYPFHPSLLSVFERKWQALPRFQQTRGVLRLLALWVSKAYSDGYKGAHKDPLISLGTAPLEDPLFRAALFEQLGESRLEPAVTTDIAGKDHAHALRLDLEATTEIKKARLHRKVATAILFESNGGQLRSGATLPEIRLAVAEPGLDIGNVEQCLEALSDTCYFLGVERNNYRFSFQPNLNKLLADRRAVIGSQAVEERVRQEITKVFSAGSGVERAYFPKKSSDINDRPALTLVVLSPEQIAAEPATRAFIGATTTENRTFKSALLWVVPEDSATLTDEARKLLAWKDIEGDADELKLDDPQKRQLYENAKRAERDLREGVWRAYKNIFLLAEDNLLRKIDLGLIHSSSGNSLVELILDRLAKHDIVVDGVSPKFLTRNWPPALPDWSTKAVRDTFYQSPKFPRLLKVDAVKDTIARGVEGGILAYVGKRSDGTYEPFIYKRSLPVADIEIDDQVFIIAAERAEEYLAKQAAPPAPVTDTGRGTGEGSTTGLAPVKPPPPEGGTTGTGKGSEPPPSLEVTGFSWTGEVSPQKWMNFYTKVLSRFATSGGLKLTVTVEVNQPGGMPASKIDETKVALRELGVSEDVQVVGKRGGTAR